LLTVARTTSVIILMHNLIRSRRLRWQFFV